MYAKVPKVALAAVLIILLILPLASAQGDVGLDVGDSGNPGLPNPLDVIGGFMSGTIGALIQGLLNMVVKAVAQIMSNLITWLTELLAHVPRPAEIQEVKDAWKKCFEIYITTLLPLSLVVLGIYIMFSTEQPTRLFFEGYLKRIGYATLLAYFSFPIIDTFVWLTNSISDLILHALVGEVNLAEMGVGVAGTILGLLGASAVSGGAAISVLAPMSPAIAMMLITSLAIVAIRIVLIYIVAATMPIFSFFMIIGVGPFKKLGEFVEYFWGLGIILPTLSVMGAVIVAFMVKFAHIPIFVEQGFMGALIMLGPLFLVFAFPMIVSSMMGAFSGAVANLLYTFTKFTRYGLQAAAGAKMASAIAMGGRLAPLYAFLPTKMAVPIHRGMQTVVSSIGRIPGGGKLAGAIWRMFPELRKDHLAMQGASALAEVGLPAASLGTLYTLASRGHIDAAHPKAVDAFEDLSASVGTLASEVVRAVTAEEREDKMRRLRATLSAIYGGNVGSLGEAYSRMLAENLSLAKKLRDPGVLGLATLLAAVGRGNPEKVLNLLQSNPEIGKYILESRFARSFLRAQGVSSRDIAQAVTGDYEAAWNISEKLKDVGFKIEPYNNTFRELVTNSSVGDIADAIIQDIKDIHELHPDKLDMAIKVYAEASGLPEVRVREVFSEVAGGNTKAAQDLAEHLAKDRGRAIATLSDKIVAESISVNITDDVEAARKISDFISEGGLVRASFSSTEVDNIRRLQMYLAQERVKQARLREYIQDRLHQYNRHFTRIDPYTYDPDTYTLDYRAAMRGWSWIRGGRRGPPA